jgi:glutathione synthase/RimK-type ligase-like ATP-grasp enzyme
MIAFGVMTLSMESEVSYIDEIAIRANSCGMECFRFLPSKIHPHTLKVTGRRFDFGQQLWIDCEFPIPTLLYDRCFYGDDEHSKQSIPIVSWLKSREDITFLGYGLPNKLDLYHALKTSVLSPYMPQSQAITDVPIVLDELKRRKKLIIKPINGSQGYGIYYLKKNNKTYHVKTEKNKKIISRIFPNEFKLSEWLKTLIQQRKYLLQPYLDLVNTELQPFDIRILLQKNELGQWVERGKGIRTGNTGGILSNLSAGGSVVDFTEWSANLSSSKLEYICNELSFILTNLPVLLEKEFLPLFELGIDIGIAKNGAIWILDVNSKPGRKVLLKTNAELKNTLSLAPLLYGKFLSEGNNKERTVDYAKALYH